MIENPILRGFNPDPSIIRIKDDYYIVTSTFEWWPGVQIYHSKDLVNWTLHSHPLNRVSQLDMRGVPDSGGIWAPCLTYDGELIYLVYTIVKDRGLLIQTENYLVTAKSMDSEWSEPVFLNCDGFDPSLFHDDDGRKWLLNLDNHYKQNKRFNGLTLQEYDPEAKCLIGEKRRFYVEPKGELVEGSHIYKFNGYYYLLKAQGGTGPMHSAQLSRSKNLFGPYEDAPSILLTSRDDKDNILQKSGHADLVVTPENEMFMVHLMSRYVPGCDEKISILGRETSIQKVRWTDDGWLELESGSHFPQVFVKAGEAGEYTMFSKHKKYLFDGDSLDINFQSLRVPLSENEMSLTERKGYLRLKGKAGLNSKFTQSHVVHRVESFNTEVTTQVEFEPECEKHLAGLTVFYDTVNWLFLHITRNNETKEKELNILGCRQSKAMYPVDQPVKLKENAPVYLRADINNASLQFSYSYDGSEFTAIGGGIDISFLSDEYTCGFTGLMTGMACADVTGYKKYADFSSFELRYS